MKGVLVHQLRRIPKKQIFEIYKSFFLDLFHTMKVARYSENLKINKKWSTRMAYHDFTAPWMRRCLKLETEIVYLNAIGVLALADHRNMRSNEGCRKAIFVSSAYFQFEPSVRPFLSKHVYDKSKILIKVSLATAASQPLSTQPLQESTTRTVPEQGHHEQQDRDQQQQTDEVQARDPPHINDIQPSKPFNSRQHEGSRSNIIPRPVAPNLTQPQPSDNTFPTDFIMPVIIPLNDMSFQTGALERNVPNTRLGSPPLTINSPLSPQPDTEDERSRNPFLQRNEDESRDRTLALVSIAIVKAQKEVDRPSHSSPPEHPSLNTTSPNTRHSTR